VADAGPNQTVTGNVTVTLDGSRSYDPDGDPLTYQWTQESGPPVTISTPTAAIARFTATAGNVYTFRLTVKDPLGAQGVARVSVGAVAPSLPLILAFTAFPDTIAAGQTSTLNWVVANADTVTISPSIGTVPLIGNRPVSPTVTTIYTLTATRGSETATQT